MTGHLDIGILKVVMDQVDLTIKELSLDAVLAPSPVSVDIGEPVVLVVKRPVGDDQLVVPRHLHLPSLADLSRRHFTLVAASTSIKSGACARPFASGSAARTFANRCAGKSSRPP